MSLLEMVDDVLDESIELPPSNNEFHIEPRCRVCRDDDVRKEVNDLLASGTSYAMVLRALGEDKTALGKGDRVTIDSVRNHAARNRCVLGKLSEERKHIVAVTAVPNFRQFEPVVIIPLREYVADPLCSLDALQFGFPAPGGR